MLVSKLDDLTDIVEEMVISEAMVTQIQILSLDLEILMTAHDLENY